MRIYLTIIQVTDEQGRMAITSHVGLHNSPKESLRTALGNIALAYPQPYQTNVLLNRCIPAGMVRFAYSYLKHDDDGDEGREDTPAHPHDPLDAQVPNAFAELIGTLNYEGEQ